MEVLYEFINLFVNFSEVGVKDNFLVMGCAEVVELWQVDVACFLLLDFSHVKVGLAEVLGRLRVCKT